MAAASPARLALVGAQCRSPQQLQSKADLVTLLPSSLPGQSLGFKPGLGCPGGAGQGSEGSILDLLRFLNRCTRLSELFRAPSGFCNISALIDAGGRALPQGCDNSL